MTIKTILLNSMMILTVVLLNGCNTVQGMGKDIKAGGQALQSAATPAKKTTTTTQNKQQPTTQSTTTRTTSTASPSTY